MELSERRLPQGRGLLELLDGARMKTTSIQLYSLLSLFPGGGVCVEDSGGFVCVECGAEASSLSRPKQAGQGVERMRHYGSRHL